MCERISQTTTSARSLLVIIGLRRIAGENEHSLEPILTAERRRERQRDARLGGTERSVLARSDPCEAVRKTARAAERVLLSSRTTASCRYGRLAVQVNDSLLPPPDPLARLGSVLSMSFILSFFHSTDSFFHSALFAATYSCAAPYQCNHGQPRPPPSAPSLLLTSPLLPRWFPLSSSFSDPHFNSYSFLSAALSLFHGVVLFFCPRLRGLTCRAVIITDRRNHVNADHLVFLKHRRPPFPFR